MSIYQKYFAEILYSLITLLAKIFIVIHLGALHPGILKSIGGTGKSGKGKNGVKEEFANIVVVVFPVCFRLNARNAGILRIID